jgi:hypothetical protein
MIVGAVNILPKSGLGSALLKLGLNSLPLSSSLSNLKYYFLVNL